MSIKIVAKFTVKSGCKEKFLELAKPLCEASRAEEGNVFYNLHQSQEGEDDMAFIEVWQDQAAIEIHNKTKHFTAIVPQLAPLMDGPMDVTHYYIVF